MVYIFSTGFWKGGQGAGGGGDGGERGGESRGGMWGEAEVVKPRGGTWIAYMSSFRFKSGRACLSTSAKSTVSLPADTGEVPL